MALTYEEGMGALRAMFPSWDAQVLAELLEANEGHLENTIDMVLTMEPPVPEPTVHAASPARSTAAASHTRSTRNDGYDANEDVRYATASPSPAPSYRKSPTTSPRRKATTGNCNSASRVLLPDDFLRLPIDASYDHHELSAQEQRDAMLAEMLQNEIFRQELFANEEFVTHFHGGDRSARQHEHDRTAARNSTAAYPDKSASEIATETFNAMSVKFATMSEAMKKKASEMYMRFQTRADAHAQKDPYSHRPLMADDSSDEEDDGTHDMRQRHTAAAAAMHSASPRTSATGPVRRANSAFASKKNE